MSGGEENKSYPNSVKEDDRDNRTSSPDGNETRSAK